MRKAEWMVFLPLLLVGCAPRDGGFSGVRSSVNDRMAFDVRWHRLDEGKSAPPDEVQALLEEPMTAESAVQVALLNNRDLQARFEDLGVASAKLLAARPENPMAELEILPGEQDAPAVEITVMQSLTSFLHAARRRSVAHSEMEATKLEIAGAVMDLGLNVRKAFFAHQAAQQLSKLRYRIATSLAASYDMARRLHHAGNITDLALDTEHAMFEEAKLAVSQAQAHENDTREALNALLGLWGPDTAWRVETRMPDPEAEETNAKVLESTAVTASLDLAQLRQSIDAEAKRVGLARTEGWLPEVEVGVKTAREDTAFQVGPVLGITLPLFDQGQAQVAAARSRLRRLRERYAATAVRIRSAVRATHTRLRATQDRALHYKQVVLPLREKVVDGTQLNYNAMQTGLFELLQARQLQIDAGARYIETLTDYWFARTDLDQLRAGRMIDAGGARPNPGEQRGPARAEKKH